MKSPNAFDETRSPFLLEVLESLGTEARETGPQDERSPAADGECECARCHESAASDEAFEGEDAFETEDEDEAGSPDAFERYQASAGEESEETQEADGESEGSESAFSREWGVESEDEHESEDEQDMAYEVEDNTEAFESEDALEAFDEAPDLAYDVVEQEDEAPFLEGMEVPSVESQVPSPPQVVVSIGEFGNALAHFARDAGLPNAVPWLLRRSAAFNAIVEALDEKYLHLERPGGLPSQWWDVWAAREDGVLTKGPHVGRRMVSVRKISAGTFFDPFGSADNADPADVIRIETPSSGRSELERRGEWLERIVHESIHAHRHVLGLRRSGSTPAARIRAAIDDEVATRTEEGRIVNDLRARFPNFGRYQPTTGSLIPGEVERDFFPGRLRLTYLEHFVLGERLEEARRTLRAGFRPNKRSRTAYEEIANYDAFVDRIPLEKRPLGSYMDADPTFTRPDRDRSAKFQQAYPRIRLIRRIIDARWRSVQDLDLNVPDPKLQKTRRDHVENMRQEHAKLFFAGLAAYTKVP